MNEKAITAYAARILKAGDSYLILGRTTGEVRTVFQDGYISLNITGMDLPSLVPCVVGEDSARVAEFAVSMGRRSWLMRPASVWRQLDAWMQADEGAMLRPCSGHIEVPALHNWRLAATDGASEFDTVDGRICHINDTMLDALAERPTRFNGLTLDWLEVAGPVRVRRNGRVEAILMPCVKPTQQDISANRQRLRDMADDLYGSKEATA